LFRIARFLVVDGQNHMYQQTMHRPHTSWLRPCTSQVPQSCRSHFDYDYLYWSVAENTLGWSLGVCIRTEPRSCLCDVMTCSPLVRRSVVVGMLVDTKQSSTSWAQTAHKHCPCISSESITIITSDIHKVQASRAPSCTPSALHLVFFASRRLLSFRLFIVHLAHFPSTHLRVMRSHAPILNSDVGGSEEIACGHTVPLWVQEDL